MTTRKRRTPEQLAQYYRDKAKKADLRAKELAQKAELNELIELGKRAKAEGFGGGNRALEILGQALVTRTLKDGLVVGGSDNLAGLRKLVAGHTEPDAWAEFADWWKAKGYPEE